MKKSNDEPCRFTRELEQRLQNGLFIFLSFFHRKFSYQYQIGDISEEAKHAYNLLINGGRTNNSLLSHDENSHCTSNGDLSINNCEKTSDHSTIPLFGSSSSSSSTSISTSSTSNNTQSNTSSSSSNQQKFDRHSHYSSTSTDNDISVDLKPQNELSPLK